MNDLLMKRFCFFKVLIQNHKTNLNEFDEKVIYLTLFGVGTKISLLILQKKFSFNYCQQLPTCSCYED